MFTSFRDSSKINENTISKEEHLALEDRVILKTDQGNTVVILNKNDYISKVKVILCDSSKFQKLPTDQNKVSHDVTHGKHNYWCY